MSKANFLVTPFDLAQVESFIENSEVAGIIIGNNKYGLRLVRNFEIDEIEQAVALAHKQKKLIYVAVNKLMHQRDLIEINDYLIKLHTIGVDGLIFSDLGVLYLVDELKLDFKLIYNTETTITNQYFTEFAAEFGIETVDLAKEISLEEIAEICANKQSKVLINIHSHIYMYQSVRKLISNYASAINEEIEQEQPLFLHDNERNTYYPVIENEQGTHIIAANDLATINHLDKIFAIDLDFQKIDGFTYTKTQYAEIVNLYLSASKLVQTDLVAYNEQKQQLLKQLQALTPNKKYGAGFLFKKTVY
ncbi:MAG: peptidase U32 family protein [Mycoplasmatales bacterium]